MAKRFEHFVRSGDFRSWCAWMGCPEILILYFHKRSIRCCYKSFYKKRPWSGFLTVFCCTSIFLSVFFSFLAESLDHFFSDWWWCVDFFINVTKRSQNHDFSFHCDKLFSPKVKSIVTYACTTNITAHINQWNPTGPAAVICTKNDLCGTLQIVDVGYYIHLFCSLSC